MIMLDKRFIVTEEGLKPVKVEPDITITKEQAVLMLNIINYFEGQQDCLDKNEEVLKAHLEGVI